VIIAFSGAKFAGKDTAAEILIKRHKFKRIGLADKLKDICSEVFQISRTDMDDPSKKEYPFKKQVDISVENIDELLRRIKRDGFEFNYEEVYKQICKDFHGKILTSIRDMLQTVGTDICRTFIKDDIWLEYIRKDLSFDDNIVITDARFKNERDYLKGIGAALILIQRPGNEGKSSHISENQLGNASDYDAVAINDSTIYALQSSISMWYEVRKNVFPLHVKR
jgi:hypothetical protein